MTQPVGPPLPGWIPPERPGRTTIRGRHVAVTPFRSDAVEELWEVFAGDDEMWTYMGYGPFSSAEELGAAVEGWEESEDPLFVTFDVDGHPTGWGSYLRVKPVHGVMEVGHLAFSSRLRKTVAATEAMYLMARRAFDELGYRRYEWKCDALNAASRSAAERLGFAYEGTFRNHMVYKGRNRDTAWYAITDGEWPLVRSALEAWLDPANHRHGAQLRRLADIRADLTEDTAGGGGGRSDPSGRLWSGH